MVHVLLLLTGALVVGVIVFGVAALVTGGDGLGDVEPDGRSVSLPGARPLVEGDIGTAQFDSVIRGYRMAQVDEALRRVAYDIGYKDELIQVLEAEIVALRAGKLDEADALRGARDAAVNSATVEAGPDGQQAGAPDPGASESDAREPDTSDSGTSAAGTSDSGTSASGTSAAGAESDASGGMAVTLAKSTGTGEAGSSVEIGAGPEYTGFDGRPHQDSAAS